MRALRDEGTGVEPRVPSTVEVRRLVCHALMAVKASWQSPAALVDQALAAATVTPSLRPVEVSWIL
jgi:hypothetical protein